MTFDLFWTIFSIYSTRGYGNSMVSKVYLYVFICGHDEMWIVIMISLVKKKIVIFYMHAVSR